VSSTSGGMSPETSIFFKKFASDIAIKWNLDYSTVYWFCLGAESPLHCRVRSVIIMATRGTSSIANTATTDILLAAAKEFRSTMSRTSLYCVFYNRRGSRVVPGVPRHHPKTQTQGKK
jgi:hypothetical protein